jgi:hypothetical protein
LETKLGFVRGKLKQASKHYNPRVYEPGARHSMRRRRSRASKLWRRRGRVGKRREEDQVSSRCGCVEGNAELHMKGKAHRLLIRIHQLAIWLYCIRSCPPHAVRFIL